MKEEAGVDMVMSSNEFGHCVLATRPGPQRDNVEPEVGLPVWGLGAEHFDVGSEQ